jgi:hypothetical protein
VPVLTPINTSFLRSLTRAKIENNARIDEWREEKMSKRFLRQLTTSTLATRHKEIAVFALGRNDQRQWHSMHSPVGSSLVSASPASRRRRSPTRPRSSSVKAELNDNDKHEHAAFHARTPRLLPRPPAGCNALPRRPPPRSCKAPAPTRHVGSPHSPALVALYCADLSPRPRALQAPRPHLRVPPCSPARAALPVHGAAYS